jgi:hypothetical protein
VVASEHERHGTRGQCLSQPPLQRIVGALEIGRGDLDVAVVDHAKQLEWIESERHVRAAVAPAVVGRTNCPRPVPRSGAVRDAVIERGPEDRDVGAPQPLGSWTGDRPQNVAPTPACGGPSRGVTSKP